MRFPSTDKLIPWSWGNQYRGAFWGKHGYATETSLVLLTAQQAQSISGAIPKHREKKFPEGLYGNSLGPIRLNLARKEYVLEKASS